MNFTFALEQFELFVLILIRLASFVFAAPFFNMANVPRKVKAGFALCLTENKSRLLGIFIYFGLQLTGQ